jgi:hypothetical protein
MTYGQSVVLGWVAIIILCVYNVLTYSPGAVAEEVRESEFYTYERCTGPERAYGYGATHQYCEFSERVQQDKYGCKVVITPGRPTPQASLLIKLQHAINPNPPKSPWTGPCIPHTHKIGHTVYRANSRRLYEWKRK